MIFSDGLRWPPPPFLEFCLRGPEGGDFPGEPAGSAADLDHARAISPGPCVAPVGAQVDEVPPGRIRHLWSHLPSVRARRRADGRPPADGAGVPAVRLHAGELQTCSWHAEPVPAVRPVLQPE